MIQMKRQGGRRDAQVVLNVLDWQALVPGLNQEPDRFQSDGVAQLSQTSRGVVDIHGGRIAVWFGIVNHFSGIMEMFHG
jgi:hypothetical protein